MPNSIITLFQQSQGIQRDGTKFSSDKYIDGQWVRFCNGTPKKMGGFINFYSHEEKNKNLVKIDLNGSNLILLSNQGAEVINLKKTIKESNYIYGYNNFGNDESLFTNDNVYSSSICFVNTIKSNSYEKYAVFSVVGDNTTNSLLYLANISKQTPSANLFSKTSIADENLPSSDQNIMTTSGVIAFPTFLMTYNNDGSISWSNPGNIFSWSFKIGDEYFQNKMIIAEEALITASRVVAGNSQLSALIWTPTSLYQVSFGIVLENNTETILGFSKNMLSNATSIISADCVACVNQTYYWIGANCFYIYSGSLSVLENKTNLQWFFSNLNQNYAYKIWSVVVPQYSEIWWHFPKGKSTECNHAIIFNYSLNIWYDTEISRDCGLSPNGEFSYPIMAKNIQKEKNIIDICLYQHEIDTDACLDVKNKLKFTPIESWFTYAYTGLYTQQNAQNRMTKIRRLELDIEQRGEMGLEVMTLAYPREEKITKKYSFSEKESRIDMSEQGRLYTMKFTSKCLFGDYWIGQLAMDWIVGDTNP